MTSLRSTNAATANATILAFLSVPRPVSTSRFTVPVSEATARATYPLQKTLVSFNLIISQHHRVVRLSVPSLATCWSCSSTFSYNICTLQCASDMLRKASNYLRRWTFVAGNCFLRPAGVGKPGRECIELFSCLRNQDSTLLPEVPRNSLSTRL
jgi:hypothetical protein